MRLSQSNKLAMFEAVSAFLKTCLNQLNSFAQFLVSLNAFDEKISDIKSLEVRRQGVAEGKTDAKHEAKDALIQDAFNISSTLFTYGRKNNIPEMKAIADISFRALERLKEIDLKTRCEQFYSEAVKITEELVDYGVTAEEIQDLRTKLDEFEAADEDQDSSSAQKAGARDSIAAKFEEADDILDYELDRFVNKFRFKDKNFYDGYYAARIIKDLGIRHTTTEEEDNNNIPS